MTASPRLRDLERRAWLRTFEHGLWDLAIGLLFLSFGLGILFDVPWIAAIAVPVGLPAMRDLARRLIVPRIGDVVFRERRRRSKTRIQILLAALALVGVGMFAFTAWATSAGAPSWVGWVRAHFVIVIGVIWGGALAIAAWAADVPRFYAYGLILFGAILASDFPTGYHLGHALVSAGGLIALIGLGLLLRFIRRYPSYPVPKEPDA
jgi:hypothetical protein